MEFVEMYMDEIKEAMEEKGIAQGVMADMIGYSRCGFNCLYHMKTIPSLKTIEKMANVLGMKPVLCLMESGNE